MTTTNSECLLRIRALRDSLGSAERRLADYVSREPSAAARCTIRELENRSGASYATVIRFCKRLGYEGFKGLRNALIAEVAEQELPTRTLDMATGLPVKRGDTPRTIGEKVLDSTIAVLRSTRSMLDPAVIDRAAQALTTAGEVYFVGTGTSGLSARYAYTRFFRTGMRCSVETDPTLYKQKAAILGADDVLVAISSSGRSANVVEAARLARANGAEVVALTDYAVSPLSKVAKINLHTTPRNVAHFMEMEMPLVVGQIALLDTLFACCCVRLGKRIDAIYQATKTAADAEKIKRRE